MIKYTSLLIIFLSCLLLPSFSLASPKIELSNKISADCQSYSDLACYHKTKKTIYISKDININLLPYLFFHEYGHYLTAELSEKELTDMFGHLINVYHKNVYEIVADHFYLFVYHQEFLSNKEKMFWTQLLIKNI